MIKHELGFWIPDDIDARNQELNEQIDGPRYYSVRSDDQSVTATVFEHEGPESAMLRITPAFTALEECLHEIGERRGEEINCAILVSSPSHDATLVGCDAAHEGQITRDGLVRSLSELLNRLSELSSDDAFLVQENALYESA